MRSATAGTPYAVTVDYESLENKDVTLRDRDSEKQIRIKISEVRKVLHDLIDGEVEFD